MLKEFAYAALGGALALTARELKLPEYGYDGFRELAGVERDKAKEDQHQVVVEVPPSLNLPLREQPLDPEILRNIGLNLVRVRTSLRQEFRHLQVSDGLCAGFVARDVRNSPVVISAAHCIPATVVSPVDGITYNTFQPDLSSIFAVKVTDSRNIVRDVTGWKTKTADVIALELVLRPSPIEAKGLPLNLRVPKKWDLFYRIGLNDQNQAEVQTLHFFEVIGERFVFIDLGDPGVTCRPGSSGSVIVNPHGEVVAVLYGSAVTTVNEEMVKQFNLDRIHIGREIRRCDGISAQTIRDLVN